jgi:AcrR family transcriptional regulator
VRTRSALVHAAELEFAQRGYAATTARSITERAGVATGSFYQYFPDKDALLRELTSSRQAALSAQLQELFDAASKPAADIESLLRRILQIVVDYHRENPALHAVISERRHADPELAAIISAGEKVLVTALFDLLQRQDSDSQTDLAATAFVLFGLVEGAVHAHVLGGAMVSDARFMSALAAASLRVALPDAGTARRAPVESAPSKRKPRRVSFKLSNRR